jgi:cytochrome c553
MLGRDSNGVIQWALGGTTCPMHYRDQNTGQPIDLLKYPSANAYDLPTYQGSPWLAKGKQAAAGRGCASCHTDTYAGTKAVARIAGQREEYLVKALHDYKSGVRSGGAQAAMADVAYPLSEEEITALAHYLAHL